MVFYHGSPIGNLTELKPFLSEHNKPYIYFSSNPLVALLYAVKPVPKPFSFYPYGFEKDMVVYSEYFENAFFRLYKNKAGYLYECEQLQNAQKPTQISCAYTCDTPVKIDSVTEIPDLYDFFISQSGFKIRKKPEISEKELQFVRNELMNDIQKHGIYNNPDHPMSVFFKSHF